ncbi:MAG: hypothetical protein ACI9J4_000525 [Paraglaciecola sp.]|jgi:hypothetical protein
MLKKLITIPFILSLAACSTQVTRTNKVLKSTNNDNETVKFSVPPAACLGDTQLPASMIGKFDAVEDPVLLKASIGDAGEGKLCQGKVYQANASATITIYRAWDSWNSFTKKGKWWAPTIPQGKTTSYQTDYEICYTWSPLDKLVRCQLKPGTKIVVGNGQSTSCPPPGDAKYPKTYILPVSAKKQIYLENARDATTNCHDFDNEFNWVEAKAPLKNATNKN